MYYQGCIVVIAAKSADFVIAGRMKLAITGKKDVPSLLVQAYVCCKNEWNIYETIREECLRRIRLDQLADYHPLTCHGTSKKFSFILPGQLPYNREE